MLWPDTVDHAPDGTLVLGGCRADDLAAEFGTPLYVFDEATLRSQMRAAREAFQAHSPNSRVVYAGKAYLSPAIARLAWEEGLGLDVVSGGELFAGLKAGVPASAMTFHGNNKSEAELREAIAAGVGLIAIDNDHDLDLLDRITAGTDLDVPVLVRLNPGIDVHTHGKIATGVIDSKFGIPIWNGDAALLLERVAAMPALRFRGYHCHLGSQLFDAGAAGKAIELIMRFAAEMRDRFGLEPAIISPGGGMGIAYTGATEPSPYDAWARASADAIRHACAVTGMPEPILLVEPGRSIVGRAAVTLYRVGAIKRIRDIRTYVSVDGGMADNIRPTLYDAVYTAELANRPGGPEHEIVTIAGRYCESGDVLITDIDLPLLQSGDLLAIPATGAYCLAMASNYNLVPRPAAVMVRDGAATLIRRRETYDDLMRMDLLPTTN